MRVEIIEPRGELGRHRWVFYLYVNPADAMLWLDYWAFETRPTSRHRKWTRQNFWDRMDKRANTMDTISVPSYVVEDLKAQLAAKIKELPISY